ncbi:MAG: 30S ribosomal protein S7 [Dehalococcoidia bacterium]|nr:30S ribosomal protein S7 [Dehalococcoidia bacterium]
MPRRARVFKKRVIPDPKFNNLVVSKFINAMMSKGKKSTARALVYDSFEIIEKQTKKDPIEVFELAIKNTTPLLQVKPRRVGGATYQVPVEVLPDRGLFLAVKWLLAVARSRKGKPMAVKLAGEIMDASQGQGATIKKREDTHKMAEANRAFAHYRW